MSRSTPASALLGARALVGHHVYGSMGQDLGAIEELMINPERGRVEYAVLARGGLFGLGEQLLAVPWDRLRFDAKSQRFFLEGDHSVLQEVPR